MKSVHLILQQSCLLSIVLSVFLIGDVKAEKPNIILVTIDDLNDWIEPLGGHPNAKTPAINKLCQNAIVFRNAVCSAPVCCPSRSSFLSGFMPNKTGVYNNGTNLLDSPVVQKNATMPEYFTSQGYYTLSTGKMFHGHRGAGGQDNGQWAFDNYYDDNLWDTPDTKQVTSSRENLIGGKTPQPLKFDGEPTKGMNWGPSENPKFENTKDYHKVDWAGKFLSGNQPLKEPFFMSIGIYKPHVPWYVPQKFFDLHPLDSIEAPHVNPDDLYDITKRNGKNVFKPTKDYKWVKSYGLQKEAAQAYLAAISEADATLGVLMDHLENSKFADNTIVVVMGDHGWHLGEKLQYHKNTLWAESVLTPLIVRTPAGKSSANKITYCENPVSLVDVFPTLIDLCGVEPNPNLDGKSFRPMLDNPSAEADTVGVTVGFNGASVLSKRWHYIENRARGPGELLARQIYDREKDPYEETNLIDSDDPEVKAAIESLSKHAPQTFAQSVQTKHQRGPKSLDQSIREARKHLR